jgi:hypothetical protein
MMFYVRQKTRLLSELFRTKITGGEIIFTQEPYQSSQGAIVVTGQGMKLLYRYDLNKKIFGAALKEMDDIESIISDARHSSNSPWHTSRTTPIGSHEAIQIINTTWKYRTTQRLFNLTPSMAYLLVMTAINILNAFALFMKYRGH